MLPLTILFKLEEAFGHRVRYTTDVALLCEKIEERTGRPIGVNTLKRLFGMVKDVREPRIYTLDTIALYLGHDTWDDLVVGEDLTNSAFNPLERIETASLKKGERIFFSYPPDREVVVEYAGQGTQFVVTLSRNSKLLKGDIVSITQFVRGLPLPITEVIRSSQPLGPFTAGTHAGLSVVKKI